MFRLSLLLYYFVVSAHFRKVECKTSTGSTHTKESYQRSDRRKHPRPEWEDASLPLPHSVHELGHSPMDELDATGGRRRRHLAQNSEIVPLFQGYGTHFAYIYVGSPGQRQSVIIDTGSHYTAFPCTGCSQCGQHTDSYWNLKNSSTAQVPQCSNQPCAISQSYSEGSSWRAFKVIDKLWVGGLSLTQVPGGPSYSIDFLFGCQTSETGLFRTQLADGIMGMALGDDTLPSQLVAKGLTKSKVFGLCYRVGGGIMTLGGVDQRIHSKPDITYAKLLHTSGWYTVNLLDIILQPQRNGTSKASIGEDKAKYNQGKGTIVDSGTTDTYLPSSISAKFISMFKDISGIAFTSGNIPLTNQQLSKIPNVIFVFESIDGKPVEIVMPWTNYVDSVGGGKYAFRIYLSEGSGVILGANFMNGYNTIFDGDNMRVGFAKSFCKYEDFAIPATSRPTIRPSKAPSRTRPPQATGEDDDKVDSPCISKFAPLEACSATCLVTKEPFVAVGSQAWGDRCQKKNYPGSGPRPCHESCANNKIVRGNPFCPEKPWTECDSSCTQTRSVPSTSGAHRANETFNSTSARCGKYTSQSRACYTGSCDTQDGDYLVFIDLRIQVSPYLWTYVHSEGFFRAFSAIFAVKESSMELLNDAGSEYTLGTKLHFQLRLKASDYKSVADMAAAAQRIPEAVWEADFPSDLIDALVVTSREYDQADQSRYGFLRSFDVQILNAMALPIGEVRDPIEIMGDDESAIIHHISQLANEYDKLLLVGVALGSVTMFLCVLCLYFRLRAENFALSKEKAGGSLYKMYERLQRLQRRLTEGADKSSYKYKKVQLNELRSLDDELDDELDAGDTI